MMSERHERLLRRLMGMVDVPKDCYCYCYHGFSLELIEEFLMHSSVCLTVLVFFLGVHSHYLDARLFG